MFTEIRCEICINHFVEIIFTLSWLYSVLEIHCSCAQWFFRFFIEGRVEGVRGGLCNPQLLNNHSMDFEDKNVSKFSRNMFTEIRCEICINHFVEIIFTLSCAVVDINVLQINCSQIFLLKMCKHLISVRSFVRPSVRFLQSATPLTVTTQWIDC
jgi:hypothetical protein